MDNYSLLLEEFHLYQKQKNQSKQFIEIIDELRIHKHSKESLLYRKKEELAKLSSQTSQIREILHTETHPKQTRNSQSIAHNQQDSKIENQLKNSQLRKQINQLEKSLLSAKTAISEIESQLSVFMKKDNEIKQLFYTSKRNLEVVQNKLKCEKEFSHELEAKNIRVLENLQTQKRNLEHELRYLAEAYGKQKTKYKEKNMLNLLNGALQMCLDGQFGVKKRKSSQRSVICQESPRSLLGRRMRESKTMTPSHFCNRESNQSRIRNILKKDQQIEQIFSKKQLQQTLTALLEVTRLYNLWVQKENSTICPQALKKQYNKIIEQSHQSSLKFRFMSKNQIVYYFEEQNKLKIDSKIFIEFYKLINSSIHRQEKMTYQMTQAITNLGVELDILQNIHGELIENKDKSTEVYLSKFQKELENMNGKIINQCFTLFQIVFKYYWVIDKMQRVYQTVQNYRHGQKNPNYKTLGTFIEHNHITNNLTNNINGKEQQKKPNSKTITSNNFSNTMNAFEKLIKEFSSKKKFSVSQENNAVVTKTSRKCSFIHNNLFPEIKQFSDSLMKCGSNILGKDKKVCSDVKKWGYYCRMNQWINDNVSSNLIFQLFFHLRKEKSSGFKSYDTDQSFDNDCDNQNDAIFSILNNYQSTTLFYLQHLQKLFKTFKQYYKYIRTLLQRESTNLQKSIQQTNAQNRDNIFIKNFQIQSTRSAITTPSYVVESKEYFRRDDYKLLEKMERLEMKKKGIFVPFRFGVDIDQQLVSSTEKKKIAEAATNKESSSLADNKLCRNQKSMTAKKILKQNLIPNTHNYISGYRERINKADKKIRQLLNTAQQMKVLSTGPLKSSRVKSSNRKFRLSMVKSPRNSVPIRSQ